MDCNKTTNGYNNHVMCILSSMESYTAVDIAVGSVLALCLVFGTLGNLTALRYFVQSPNNSLATKLYTAICAIDVFTCLTHFPVMIALLNHRVPGIFNSLAVCGMWTTVFEFLQRASIFLVMLLTVTRTVAITFPFQFHKINDNSAIVVGIFAGHCALGVLEIIAWQTVRTSFIYVADLAYCAKTIPHPGVLMAENIIYSVEVGFPAVVIVLSFMISTVGLAIKGRDARAMDSQRASVTIASFTCLFLVCTMPFFVVMVMYLTDQKYQLDSQYPGDNFSNHFVYWHSWSISKIGFVVLNATLNPLLYYFRMSGFKTWLNAKVTKTRYWNSVSHDTTYGDVAMETIKSSGSCTPRFCASPVVDRDTPGDPATVVGTADC